MEVHEGVKNVWLADNAIGDRGAGAISRMLMVNDVVNSLDLAENRIGNEGGFMLLEAISRKGSNLTDIDLSENLLSSPLEQLLTATAARNVAAASGNVTKVQECEEEVAYLRERVFAVEAGLSYRMLLFLCGGVAFVSVGVFIWTHRRKKLACGGLPLFDGDHLL